MTNGTERALTVDLVTGESYELSDIFNVDRDFIVLWDKSLSEDVQAFFLHYRGERFRGGNFL